MARYSSTTPTDIVKKQLMMVGDSFVSLLLLLYSSISSPSSGWTDVFFFALHKVDVKTQTKRSPHSKVHAAITLLLLASS